jgi:hypothetical protein
MAPNGARLIGLGSRILASALPRHIKPSGMLPPPMNTEVSSIILKGGNPSGAVPTRVFDSSIGTTKSALSRGTTAMTSAAVIATVGGEATAAKKLRIKSNTRLSLLACRSSVGDSPVAVRNEVASLGPGGY